MRLLILSIVFSFGVAWADEVPPKTEPLVVGVIAPLSGDYAKFGVGTTRGAELANETLPGRALKLVFEDNKTCQPADAISAFHKLVSSSGAKVIVTFCTAAAQGIMPLARQRGIPVIQLTESGPDPENYLLKLMPDSTGLATILADDFVKRYRKMALVANETEVNTGPRGNLPLFRKDYEARGGKIVLSETFQDNVTDFRSLIVKIQQSGADAVTPFIWPPAQMSIFLKQADELKLWNTVKLAGNFAFEIMYNELVPLYPHLAQMDGLESANLVQLTSPEFAAAYSKKYQETPPQFADYSYDAIAILKRCGAERSCFRQSFEGASGAIAFDATDRRIGKLALKRLQGGKFIWADGGGAS